MCMGYKLFQEIYSPYVSLFSSLRLMCSLLHHVHKLNLGSNPCQEDNGNCTHMCLLSSTYPEGYGCNCPDGLVLAGDGRTCSSMFFLMICFMSDSFYCYNILTVCPANSFICDNAVCIPSIWECDSIDDCGDNSDEDHCNG